MSPQIKVLIAKPENLSLIPRTHLMEGEKQPIKLPFDLCIHAMACRSLHAHDK